MRKSTYLGTQEHRVKPLRSWRLLAMLLYTVPWVAGTALAAKNEKSVENEGGTLADCMPPTVSLQVQALKTSGLPALGVPTTVTAGGRVKGVFLQAEVPKKCVKFDKPLPNFTWTLVSKPGGSQAVLTGHDTLAPSIKPDKVGTYTLRFTACPGGCTLALPTSISSHDSVTVAPQVKEITFTTTDPRQLLVDAYKALHDKLVEHYGMKPHVAPTKDSLVALNQGVVVYASFPGKFGNIVFEVQSTGSTVWVAVPHPDRNSHLWFEFENHPDKGFTPVSKPGKSSTPFPAWGLTAFLDRSDAWAGGNEKYNFTEAVLKGVDPAHWVPILYQKKGVTDVDARLHDLMWSSPAKGKEFIDAYRPHEGDASNGDLTDRAMLDWPPMTVRGTVTKAEYPGSDFGWDHSTGYNNGEDTPSGSQAEVQVSDPSWPGLDWDMNVRPDRDTLFLRTNYDANKVGVEIEQFSIPEAYRPQVGDWLQASGRWVIDTGHPDEENTDGRYRFYSELHPPELLVASRMKSGHITEARVIATGAWGGERLRFVVFPPARPSATARLKFKILKSDGTPGVDQQVNTKFTLTEWPSASQPNHLVGSLRGTSTDPIFLYPSGMVGQTSKRGFRAIIQCWWEDGKNTATVNARLMAGSKPAKGARLFYFDPDTDSPWESVPVDANGNAKVTGLLPKAYVFRPAGSGWNFSKVPQRVELTPGVQNLTFQATAVPDETPATIMSSAFLMQGVAREVYLTYARQLVLVDFENGGSALGVSGSGMPFGFYSDSLEVLLHVSQLLDKNGNPLPNLKSSYLPKLGGQAFLLGTVGPGVSGATLRVRFIANRKGGFQTVADLPEVKTDAAGNVRIRLQAGSHVQEGFLWVEVSENPGNPWFTPTRRSNDLLFYPERERDDSKPPVPYVLSVVPEEPQTAARVVRKMPHEVRELEDMGKIHRDVLKQPTSTARVKPVKPRVRKVQEDSVDDLDGN